MKSLSFKVLFVILIFVFTSCSTKQSIIVSGIPGTVIQTQNHDDIAIIDDSGHATITIDKYPYHVNLFLLAKAPNSDVAVPFALDYKDINRDNSTLLLCGALALIATSPIFMLSGSTAGGIVGGLELIAGVVCGMHAVMIETIGHDDFDYIKNQTTNNDLIIDSNNKTSE